MEENLISLPSGVIINLLNVSLIRPVGQKIRVLFTATRVVADDMHIDLDGEDSQVLLNELRKLGTKVKALRKKIGIEEESLAAEDPKAAPPAVG